MKLFMDPLGPPGLNADVSPAAVRSLLEARADIAQKLGELGCPPDLMAGLAATLQMREVQNNPLLNLLVV